MTSAIWGQYPVFSHPEFPQTAPSVLATVWWLLDGWHSLFPSWTPSGLTVEGGCNHWWLRHSLFSDMVAIFYFSLSTPPLTISSSGFQGEGSSFFLFSLTSVSFTASSFPSCASQECFSCARHVAGDIAMSKTTKSLPPPVYNWVFYLLPIA